MGATNPETKIGDLPGVGPKKTAALEADGFEIDVTEDEDGPIYRSDGSQYRIQ